MNARNRLNGVSVLPPMTERQRTPEKPHVDNQRKESTPSTPKRSGQRFKILNDFVDLTMQLLKPSQTKVWLCLYRDSRDGIATAAQTYIAERCGLKRPTVSKTIGELEARGLVVIIHRGGLNRGISKYRVEGIIKGN